MGKKKSKQAAPGSIVRNKRATFEFKIEEKIEAGLELQGWEVKSLRMGKVTLADTYVFIKEGECWMHGCTITPLNTASTHTYCEPARLKKLLLNRREIDKLEGLVERQGYTIVPLSLYWRKGAWVKVEIGLGKGKKEHDKRDASKERDWEREKSRTLKGAVRK
ncbi:SsrA-binding protein SmpB [Parashewanella tropica]|uniref:SsrA-binding protein SmpB n=1 Tax=Parashewanella tropica TaxID=2547970 RepID=UPI00105968D3|nr:SsrA-binding protein SmpB [Parashewanella tropica]